jgi:hypothetical protein
MKGSIVRNSLAGNTIFVCVCLIARLNRNKRSQLTENHILYYHNRCITVGEQFGSPKSLCTIAVDHRSTHLQFAGLFHLRRSRKPAQSIWPYLAIGKR